MQLQLFIQAIFLLINSSIVSCQQDDRLASIGAEQFAKIDRINRISKKLDLIEEEEVINQNLQNQLIDALEQDTFSPHQTVTVDWSAGGRSSSSKAVAKDNEQNKNEEPNKAHDHSEYDLSAVREGRPSGGEVESLPAAALHNHHLVHSIPEESVGASGVRTTRKKVAKKRNSKSMDKQTSTSAMPYSTSAQRANTLSKDTTRYTINTYSSVSYNPSHHHLQYKQININHQPASNQSAILLDTLASTFSLNQHSSTAKDNGKLDDDLYGVPDDGEPEKGEPGYRLYSGRRGRRPSDRESDDSMTTPISVENPDKLNELNKIRTRRMEKSVTRYPLVVDNLEATVLDKDRVVYRALDLLEHHQLLSTSPNGFTMNLMDNKAAQIKAKNQHELRLNRSEVIKINWPVKKAVDLPGDISLGGLMMIHERDENFTCGAVMPQGGIQVSFTCDNFFLLVAFWWSLRMVDDLPANIVCEADAFSGR